MNLREIRELEKSTVDGANRIVYFDLLHKGW